MDTHATPSTFAFASTAAAPSTSSDTDGGDVWGDDLSDGEFHRTMADRDYQRIQQAHKDAGYREGIIEGKDLTMQSGFDDGYATGSQLGLVAGRITGKLRSSMLAARLLSSDHDLLTRGNFLLANVRSMLGSVTDVFAPEVVQELYQDFEARESDVGSDKARDRVMARWAQLEAMVDAYVLEVKAGLVRSPSAA